MYSAKLMEHFYNPRNVGTIADAQATALISYPPCGDWLELSVKIEDGKVSRASFRVQGCGGTVAAGSVLTELLRNKNLEALKNLTVQDIVNALDGLPEGKMHCARMALDAVQVILRKLEGDEALVPSGKRGCDDYYETLP